jgi:hypothetical protein
MPSFVNEGVSGKIYARIIIWFVKYRETIMQIFDDDIFRDFIGDAWLIEPREWGHEWRFSVSKQNLEIFSDILRDTIYHHHSSFTLYDDIAELGFTSSAQSLRNRHSGNPGYHNTRMGNLGEVVGTHFVKSYLGYQSTLTFPKRLNTNVEQSMKGIDVLGFKDSNSPAGILIGEVKTGAGFAKSAIEDAYDELFKRKKNELPTMLHFAKEYFTFQNDKEETANIERHMKKNMPRNHLLLSITDSNPKNPFDSIPEYRKKYGEIEEILAVHIEIKGLIDLLPVLFS